MSYKILKKKLRMVGQKEKEKVKNITVNIVIPIRVICKYTYKVF